MSLVRENGRWRTVRTEDEQKTKLTSMFASLSEDEQDAVRALLEDEAVEENPVFRAVTELEYEFKPVDPRTFYDDEYYLGHVSLWPRLKDDLVELHEGGYEEAVLTGSLGWGKSFFGAAAMAYVIYQLSCLRHPQRSYGLDATSTIYLSFVGPTIQLAQRSIYAKTTEFIKASPYFQDNFNPRVIKSTTTFPKGVSLIAGSTSSNAGMALDVFGGVIDEANFFLAQRSEHDLSVMLDRAKLIYEAIRRRMENRFMRSGRLPGLLVIDSSAKHQSSFTVQKIKEARYDDRIFVRDYATWDVQPKDRFIGKYFYVAVGDNNVRSRVLEDEADIESYKSMGANMHPVPVEFKAAFDKDLETSIQDILGVPTADVSFYIQNHKALNESSNAQRHPFAVQEYIIGVTKKLYIWNRIAKQVETMTESGEKELRWIPLVSPHAPRCVHLDLSKSQDATGLAIGHIDRYVEVVRRDPETGEDTSEMAPIIYIDAMLRILPAPGRDIILAEVRSIVYSFQQHGFHIYRGTSDQYQSLDTIQQFEAKGMQAETLSLDKTPEPYSIFKSALYEGRVKAYHYKPWIDEVKSLKRIVTKSQKVKIDHPYDKKEGTCSKDVADAVAGGVFSLETKPPGRVAVSGDFVGAEHPRQDPSLVDIERVVEEDGGVSLPFLLSDPMGPDEVD